MHSRLLHHSTVGPRSTNGLAHQRALSAPWPPCSAAACSRARQRRPRTVAVRAERSLYEVLGVDPTASDRDIKRAYRQKALKLHPDVNKAPGAEAAFMEVKAAFGVLSDAAQRAEYDRRRRFGGFGGGAWGGGGFGGAWGGTSASGSAGGAGAGARRPKQPEEEFYGLGDLFASLGRDAALQRGLAGAPAVVADFLAAKAAEVAAGASGAAGWAKEQAARASSAGLADFFRDLEAEADQWAKKRADQRGGAGGAGGAKPMSLWEELAAIGEEFVEYLESALPTEDEDAAKGSGGGGAGRPVDEYEAWKRRYGSVDGGGSGTGTSGNGTTSSSSSGSRAKTDSAQAPPPPPPPRKTADEEVDDMLAALKKKLGKS